jgi:hypothetical protein
MSFTEKQQKQVVATFNELKSRLLAKGIVMTPSDANGKALLAYCIKNNLDYQNLTVDTLQQAFNAIWPTDIKFEKGFEPGPLKSKAPLQGTHAATVKAQAELGNREQMAKAQAEKDAEAKRESVAQKATEEAIAAFALTKGGSMRYAPTQEFQTLLKQNVDKFRRDGMKWQLIFPQIKTWIAEKYREFESQQSQSSTGGW